MYYYTIMLNLILGIECAVEKLIEKGENAAMKNFPHSVFLFVSCSSDGYWICGASIVNEGVLLTAAHCLFTCGTRNVIKAYVGNRKMGKGKSRTVQNFYLHKKYEDFSISNDIALMKVKKKIIFGKNVKRVALMRKRPKTRLAQVAGWGIIDEKTKKPALNLQSIKMHILKRSVCRERFYSRMPEGTNCADSVNPKSAITEGDSGSALVVRGYIQIGIVSYKVPKISRSLVVYTDTGYFYDWITHNTKRLYCA
ncbi:hypodermin-B isoform X3 [Helicoverpa armigera]|uniref:hypodermin-B isoform X3 n=1 Tax=Helicoverpa armigera TaxID=29058 RepID=UPI0030827BC8